MAVTADRNSESGGGGAWLRAEDGVHLEAPEHIGLGKFSKLEFWPEVGKFCPTNFF